MTIQAVGIDSCVIQRSHEGPLFEAVVGARSGSRRNTNNQEGNIMSEILLKDLELRVRVFIVLRAQSVFLEKLLK